MKTIKIINSPEKVSENFTFQEYFNTTISHTRLEFDIPECLILGMQFLRDYFKMPLLITSAYRPDDTFGFHRTGCAVDTISADNSKALEIISNYKEECLNHKKSPLIAGLRERGVNGFGVEGNCIHLDYRPDGSCSLKDNLGKYCIFKWRPDGTEFGHSEIVW